MQTLRYFDDDWDTIRDTYAAWWRRQAPPRPPLAVFAPRDTPLPCPTPPPAPADPREAWLDAAGNCARFEAAVAKTYHGGMAFPYLTPSLGPGSLNLFLGAAAGFDHSTVWYHKCFDHPADIDLRLDPDNEYWRWTVETTRHYLRRAEGKFIVGMPDIIEGLDILAGLLGTQELLMYMVDCPEQIHRLLDQLDDLYFQAFDPLYEMIRDERGGNAFIAFQIYGPGKTLKTQCDFAAMISPRMFAEFVCPHMQRQCERADFSLYHLDGPDCIRHLDVLLTHVPALDAVQWVPGAGNAHPHNADPHWWDIIWRPVYEAGKAVQVLNNPPEMIEQFVREFGWTGTFAGTYCQTERQARDMLDAAANWSRC